MKCEECGQDYNGVSYSFRNIGVMCSQCYALFLAVNRVLIHAHL